MDFIFLQDVYIGKNFVSAGVPWVDGQEEGGADAGGLLPPAGAGGGGEEDQGAGEAGQDTPREGTLRESHLQGQGNI
jgi:hypothetical protein